MIHTADEWTAWALTGAFDGSVPFVLRVVAIRVRSAVEQAVEQERARVWEEVRVKQQPEGQ